MSKTTAAFVSDSLREMKLETNLTNRAGMMYNAPLLDVVLLLLVFFLLGSSLILKSEERRIPTPVYRRRIAHM